MKTSQFCRLFVASLMVAVAAVGCKKGPKSVTPIPTATAKAPGSNTPGGIANPGRTDPGVPVFPTDNTATRSTGIPMNPDGSTPLGDTRESEGNYIVDREVFKQQVAYFDYDRSEVRPSERPKLDQVAAYLRSEPNARLRVEGHCDERGTPEYNRSLGERRALSAREYLISVGIVGERIGTLSWGEDKSVDPGQDEAAYAKNRGGEFVLLRPKQ